jgi:hypothetical protein
MASKKLIKIRGSILVNRSVDSVFNFFANPSNDKFWRSEINQSTLEGSLQLGVLISEYSHLSKKVSNNLLELQCVQFDQNKIAVFETNEKSQFYQRSERQLNVISDNKTEIIYTLTFDINIVKFALGFALPKFIVSLKANSDMKKYLKQLKTKLEND